MSDVINVFSPGFNPYDSYGKIGLELASGFRAQGYHVNQYGEDDGNSIRQISFGGLLLGYPTNFHKFGMLASQGPRIAITMFESTQLPTGWVPVLNTMDAVIVPCPWLMDLFRQQGVQIPIHPVALGLSREFLNYHPRTSKDVPFTFLAFADRGERKGWYEASRAFVGAFGDRLDVKLILKCRDHNLPMLQVSNPNIVLLKQDMTLLELNVLYQKCHVMIAAARGEGFGFLPREFAATGGLSLVTDWGGLSWDVNEWAIPLTYEMVSAWGTEVNLRGLGLWASVRVDDLRDRLIEVRENYDQYEALRKDAHKFTVKKYRWQQFCTRVGEIWEDILEARYGSNRRRDQQTPVLVRPG